VLQVDYTVWFKKGDSIKLRGLFYSLDAFKQFVASRFNFSDEPVRHTIDEVLELPL